MAAQSARAETTVRTVQEAVRLCEENARRLLRNATLLLDNGGSDGLAYALWSLAVEEFGKSRLLLGQVEGRDPDDKVSVQHDYRHHEKFTAGFEILKDLKNTSLARLFRVTGNTSAEASTFDDPLRPDLSIAIPPFTTGLFEDVSAVPSGVDPTVALRMVLIYVDWDEKSGRWIRPGETFRRAGVIGRWELDACDLRRAIDSLGRHVAVAV